jgi:hypothetical protein
MNKKDEKILADATKGQIPVFVIIAKDAISIEALRAYRDICVSEGCPVEHIAGIQSRIKEFEDWQANNMELVSQPD